MRICALLLGLAFSIPANAADTGQPPATTAEPQYDEPITDPQISTFTSLVKAASLMQFFQGTGPFTAFVPSNEAFEKFGQDKIEKLKKPENLDQLIDLINYHITLGKYLAKNLKTRSFRAVNGKELNVRVEDGQITVNGAKVIRTDLIGPNGVIDVIDTVLVP